METKDGYIEFLLSESNKNQVNLWYKAYNINRERVELFRDFFISIIYLLETTYLGSEYYTTEEDIKNHFTWCFNTTVSNFEKEKIYFKKSGDHFEYLYLFFYQSFYMTPQENELTKVQNYFENLFDFNFQKTHNELIVLTEIYRIFNQNLKK